MAVYSTNKLSLSLRNGALPVGRSFSSFFDVVGIPKAFNWFLLTPFCPFYDLISNHRLAHSSNGAGSSLGSWSDGNCNRIKMDSFSF